MNRACEYNLTSRGLLEERARGFVTFATMRSGRFKDHSASQEYSIGARGSGNEAFSEVEKLGRKMLSKKEQGALGIRIRMKRQVIT